MKHWIKIVTVVLVAAVATPAMAWALSGEPLFWLLPLAALVLLAAGWGAGARWVATAPLPELEAELESVEQSKAALEQSPDDASLQQAAEQPPAGLVKCCRCGCELAIFEDPENHAAGLDACGFLALDREFHTKSLGNWLT